MLFVFSFINFSLFSVPNFAKFNQLVGFGVVARLSSLAFLFIDALGLGMTLQIRIVHAILDHNESNPFEKNALRDAKYRILQEWEILILKSNYALHYSSNWNNNKNYKICKLVKLSSLPPATELNMK